MTNFILFSYLVAAFTLGVGTGAIIATFLDRSEEIKRLKRIERAAKDFNIFFVYIDTNICSANWRKTAAYRTLCKLRRILLKDPPVKIFPQPNDFAEYIDDTLEEGR